MWLVLSWACTSLNLLHHSVSSIRQCLTLSWCFICRYMCICRQLIFKKSEKRLVLVKLSPSPQCYLDHKRRKMSLRLFQSVYIQLLSSGTVNSHYSIVVLLIIQWLHLSCFAKNANNYCSFKINFSFQSQCLVEDSNWTLAHIMRDQNCVMRKCVLVFRSL